MMWQSVDIVCRQHEPDGQITSVKLKAGDIVRCAHTGFFFHVHFFMKPVLGYGVDEGKGIDSAYKENSPECTLAKCQSARYFGGPRVCESIFQSSTEVVVMLTNKRHGLVFKTMDTNNMLTSMVRIDTDNIDFPEEMRAWVDELCGSDGKVCGCVHPFCDL